MSAAQVAPPFVTAAAAREKFAFNDHETSSCIRRVWKRMAQTVNCLTVIALVAILAFVRTDRTAGTVSDLLGLLPVATCCDAIAIYLAVWATARLLIAEVHSWRRSPASGYLDRYLQTAALQEERNSSADGSGRPPWSRARGPTGKRGSTVSDLTGEVAYGDGSAEGASQFRGLTGPALAVDEEGLSEEVRPRTATDGNQENRNGGVNGGGHSSAERGRGQSRFYGGWSPGASSDGSCVSLELVKKSRAKPAAEEAQVEE